MTWSGWHVFSPLIQTNVAGSAMRAFNFDDKLCENVCYVSGRDWVNDDIAAALYIYVCCWCITSIVTGAVKNEFCDISTVCIQLLSSRETALQDGVRCLLCRQDECAEVRKTFVQKLHKGLMTLRLPLQYLSIMCLAANETNKSHRIVVKQMLAANISRRREYLRQNSVANSQCFLYHLCIM